MKQSKNNFPSNFLWGASTSAYQFEGGWDADGKGLNTQDVRTNIPEGTTDFKVASDHYHNWKEDVALMAEMGFKSYRFSISWSRVISDGKTKINQKGLEFYKNLIDELIKFKITPIVTMFHFDLPNELQKEGGWLNRDIIGHFENYAKVLFENFGDKVKHWLTINEQNVMILYGPIVGIDLPEGANQLKSLHQINHHMMLAQAKVIKLCHQMVKAGKIGPAPNINCVYANTNNPIDHIAANNMLHMRNWYFLDTLVFGKYNKTTLKYLQENDAMFDIQEGDMEVFKDAKPDFIAFNYYASATVKMQSDDLDLNQLTDQQKLKTIFGWYEQVLNPQLPKTQFGWEIDPIGLRTTLNQLDDRYNLPLLITENGIGGYDELVDGAVEDDYRIEYYKMHIEQLNLALGDGVQLMGYNPWSAIDLVSTHEGVKKRYGFVFVNRDEFDLKDMKRYRKKSFYWYKQLIENNGSF